MRTTQTFLTDWLFCFDAKTEDTADFVLVTLPHTWNNLDGQDGGTHCGGYTRFCVEFV